MKVGLLIITSVSAIFCAGCTSETQGELSRDEQSVASSINYVLRSIGETELCEFEAKNDESVFRMVENPFRGPIRITSVRTTPEGGLLRSSIVNIDDGIPAELSIGERYESQLGKTIIDKLWLEIDASRVWDRRTSLTDVEDGKYVTFDALGLADHCRPVILLSPDSAGVVRLMNHVEQLATASRMKSDVVSRTDIEE